MINKHYFNEHTARSTRRAINAHRPVSRNNRHMNEGVVVTTATNNNDSDCFAGCISQSDVDYTTELINTAASDLTCYFDYLKDNTFLYLQQALYSLCNVTKSVLMPYCKCECETTADENFDFDIVVDERTIAPATKNAKMNRK